MRHKFGNGNGGRHQLRNGGEAKRSLRWSIAPVNSQQTVNCEEVTLKVNASADAHAEECRTPEQMRGQNCVNFFVIYVVAANLQRIGLKFCSGRAESIFHVPGQLELILVLLAVV